jgi:hypothetical protein
MGAILLAIMCWCTRSYRQLALLATCCRHMQRRALGQRLDCTDCKADTTTWTVACETNTIMCAEGIRVLVAAQCRPTTVACRCALLCGPIYQGAGGCSPRPCWLEADAGLPCPSCAPASKRLGWTVCTDAQYQTVASYTEVNRECKAHTVCNSTAWETVVALASPAAIGPLAQSATMTMTASYAGGGLAFGTLPMAKSAVGPTVVVGAIRDQTSAKPPT